VEPVASADGAATGLPGRTMHPGRGAANRMRDPSGVVRIAAQTGGCAPSALATGYSASHLRRESHRRHRPRHCVAPLAREWTNCLGWLGCGRSPRC